MSFPPKPPEGLTFSEYLEAKYLIHKAYEDGLTEARERWVALSEAERADLEMIASYSREKQVLANTYREAMQELHATPIDGSTPEPERYPG